MGVVGEETYRRSTPCTTLTPRRTSMAAWLRRWPDGEPWIEWARRKIRTAKFFIEFYTPGFLSQNWLGSYWSWAGHVARLDCERRVFQMTRNWCLQWKREGIASHRGLNVYNRFHQWKLRGSGRAYDLIWEKRLDEFCDAQNWNWWEME